MVKVVKINIYLINKPPFSNLKIRCNTKKINMKIIGNNAGNNLKLSTKLPFNSSTNALCIPHPGHSIPKYFL